MFKMTKAEFSILLDLQDYFSDDRQNSKIYINQNYSKISDLEDRISQIFGIKWFHLLSEGHFLPDSEDIAILKEGETIRVKPNISQSQSILLADTYYDKNNETNKRMNLSEDISHLRSKRRKKKVIDNEEAILPIVNEKKDDLCANKDHFSNNECRLHSSTLNTSKEHHISNKNIIENHASESNRNQGKLEKEDRQYISRDHFNNDECSLHSSTLNSTNTHIPNRDIKGVHSSEEKLIKTKSKKNYDKVDNIKSKVIKAKNRLHKKLEEQESSVEENTSLIFDLKNQEFNGDDSNIEPNLLQNHRYSAAQKNISLSLIEDNMSYSQPIPYKKAKLKSWSTSPLLKSTNIVKIIKTPSEKIEIDLSRFEFAPEDDLPPLKPIDIEYKNSNNSIEKYEKVSIQSQEHSENPVNFPNELQNKIESMKSQSFYVKSIEVESQNMLETMKPNSNLIQSQNFSYSLEKVKSKKDTEELQQIKSLTSFDTSNRIIELENYSDRSHQMQSQKCLEIPEISKSQYCLPELQHMNTINTFIKLKQDEKPQDCCENGNIELIQSQNFAVLTEQEQLHDVPDITLQCSEVSQQPISQNLFKLSQESQIHNVLDLSQQTPEVSQQPKLQPTMLRPSLELMTTSEQLPKVINWSIYQNNLSKLSQNALKESRYKSRERWRHKISTHTKGLLSSFKFEINHSEKLEQSSLCHNYLPNEKSTDFETINQAEISKDLNIIESQTTNYNKTSPNPDAVKHVECLFNENLNVNEEIMKIGDGMVNSKTDILNGNLRSVDDNTVDLTVSHETIAGNTTFPNPKRKRKRYRKKRTNVKVLPKQEAMKECLPKWTEFIPGKPKIHLKFNSSDDEIHIEKNEVNRTLDVIDNLATCKEKIKILQDVTINPDTDFHTDHVESEAGVLTGQGVLLSDRYSEISENGNPSGFSNDQNDYYEKLLQAKKNELLKTVDCFTLTE